MLRVTIHRGGYSDVTDHMKTWRHESLKRVSVCFKSYFQKTVPKDKGLTLSTAQDLFIYRSVRHNCWSRSNDCPSKLISLILYSKCFCAYTKNKEKAAWTDSVSRKTSVKNCQFSIRIRTEVSKRKSVHSKNSSNIFSISTHLTKKFNSGY